MKSYTWASILEKIPGGQKIEEGFGGAERHIVTMPDSSQLFVKRSLDTSSAKRIQKEISVYSFLEQNNFTHAPKLIATAPDNSGFVIEALTHSKGWDWNGSWTFERLEKTLQAMDELLELTSAANKLPIFQVTTEDHVDDAWEIKVGNEQHGRLVDMLRKSSTVQIEDINFADLTAKSSTYSYDSSSLIHNDVRRDNCAWNAARKEVRLIDWDWAQLGDKRVDVNSLLVNVHKSGLDVTGEYAEKLDGPTLAWLANYWFKSAATPIWEGGKASLRNFQLDSALTAYALAKHVGYIS